MPDFSVSPTQAKLHEPAIPRHIAIIMDGNGRWAQQRGLPRTAGHQVGVQKVRQVTETCGHLGVAVLTLYAFSTENWKRSATEVGFLMGLFEEYANQEIETLNRNNVRLQFLGRRDELPPSVRGAIERSTRLTAANTGQTLNIALNYGGRAEITDAARGVIAAVQRGELSLDDLDEATFDRFLYTAGLPDPDLIIRTGGEWRVSNFLIWQGANAFFWVTTTLWPDFGPEELEAAITAWSNSRSG